MSSVTQALGDLWKVGGLPLVVLFLAFFLLRFIGNRAVKALDGLSARIEHHAAMTSTSVTTAMREIANSVTSSAAANVQAMASLTDRVSRMEGVVAGLGLAALQEVRGDAADWADEGPTPVERPGLIARDRIPLPKVTKPSGPYHMRPSTDVGRKKG